MKEAKRLENLSEYYFSKKLEEVRALDAQGKNIINLGIGSPDLPPPLEAVNALTDALLHPNAHQYQPYKGQLQFREAIRDFYKEQYGVELDAISEILPLIGSKEGILHISMAFLNESDEVLIPNPGYPTYAAVTKLVGAKAVNYDLTEDSGWLPNLEQLSKMDLSKVKLMWVNYPHMPTGTIATKKLFKDLIAFGKKHDILIVNDNPYSFVLNKNPLSILSVEGAKETALELNSLSKTFNMAGWRVGMVCGSEKHLKTILKVKSNMDSGMFFPVQAGAIAAMRNAEQFIALQNKEYLKRREKAIALAFALECRPLNDSAGLFVWSKITTGISSEEFIDKLLHKYGIFVAPGMIFGSNGEGYIRISLCASEEKFDAALNKIEKEKLIYTEL
ncbi:pyridoxal phosphate-dependent aminotransferase [Gillisia marina]|uniref:pyridoxal phosphate-dependent aminotransferase n=1 Tax=Gillisia marina TaxID=1167637 RepID=UPI00029A65EA|nr:aminotransferase class I/II-fold pyridoxal phosphate-dependent enzyme [Gillisia marina]